MWGRRAAKVWSRNWRDRNSQKNPLPKQGMPSVALHGRNREVWQNQPGTKPQLELHTTRRGRNSPKERQSASLGPGKRRLIYQLQHFHQRGRVVPTEAPITHQHLIYSLVFIGNETLDVAFMGLNNLPVNVKIKSIVKRIVLFFFSREVCSSHINKLPKFQVGNLALVEQLFLIGFNVYFRYAQQLVGAKPPARAGAAF